MALSSYSFPQVAASEPEESKSPDEEFGGMAGALARALEMRSNAIHGDSGKKTHPLHCTLRSSNYCTFKLMYCRQLVVSVRSISFSLPLDDSNEEFEEEDEEWD